MEIPIEFWKEFYIEVPKDVFDMEISKINTHRDAYCNGEYYVAVDWIDKPRVGIHCEGKYYLRRNPD